ncbi:NAD(P)/FAD-dependent oxidoreductase [Sulfobacillus thermotolerans]|uniref:NAD(P)/FAD-dependent oxidoreductase n=1 Tax=Sulfobacillus thermotolerans TaxID=338644 RepID=UPI0033696AE1
MDRRKVIILGTGPAGLTAAIYAARANLKPLVIEGNEPGGQLTLTTEIENFPGFPDAILGPDLEAYTADALIISTGASAKMLGIPGEAELIGHGVSTCATCDGFFFRDKPIIVVGGGDSAMEEASFLTKFASEVTIVHRRETLRASKVMQDRAHANPKIKWAMDQTPIRVVSEDNHVTGLEVQDNKTGQKHIIPAEGLFIAIGHKPNTSFLNNQLKTDKVGYLKTNLHNSATSVEGIFACGDVMDPHYRQAITAAGSGCKAAMDVEKYLEGAFVYDWSMSEPD